jgi:hypothetical protein
VNVDGRDLDRLNEFAVGCRRSMLQTDGRPFPGFGYTGSMCAPSSHHGTTRSISTGNCARRVTLVCFSSRVPASVSLRTSHHHVPFSRVMLLVASRHNSREGERLIQRFPQKHVVKELIKELNWQEV